MHEVKMKLALFYIILLGTIWGLHFSVIRFATETGLEYTSITAFVVICDILVMILICWFRKQYPRINKSTMLFYLVCSLFGYIIPFFVELFSAERIGAGLLTIVVSLTPVITVFVALLLQTESISFPKILAIGFGLLAILPLFVFNEVSLNDLFGLGLIIALIVPASYAVYHNYVAKYWPDGMDSWQVATGETLAAGAIMVPLFLATGTHEVSALLSPINSAIVAVFVLFSVLEIYLYFEVVRLAGAVFVSQASFITVATGVVWGMVFFGEEHGSWIWGSILVLCLSIYLSVRYSEVAKN